MLRINKNIFNLLNLGSRVTPGPIKIIFLGETLAAASTIIPGMDN